MASMVKYIDVYNACLLYRSVMECHIYQKASGCAGDVYSHHPELWTVVSVLIKVEHSNRLVNHISTGFTQNLDIYLSPKLK